MQQPPTARPNLRALRKGVRPPEPRRRLGRTAALGSAIGITIVVLLLLFPALPTGAPGQEVAILRLGSVESSLEAEALVVRTERVYTAPVSGSVRRLAAGDGRVRVGTPVVELMPNVPGSRPIAVEADAAGLVSYVLDGLEGRLSPGQAASGTPAWFRALDPPAPRPAGEGPVLAGAPVFKLIDNFSHGLAAVVEGGDLPLGYEGGAVGVRLPWHQRLVTATIGRLAREGSEALLYLTAPLFPDELMGVRRVRMLLVFSSYSGKVVPRSAIDVREGRQGVWVLEGGVSRFVPGRVVGGNQTEVVLETDIAQGTRILRTAPLHIH